MDSHFIIQFKIAALGAYPGVSVVLDLYPGAGRVLMEHLPYFSLKQWLSHTAPKSPTVKAAWMKYGGGMKIPTMPFIDNLKEMVKGMALIHSSGVWPERLAELHSALFGADVRGTSLGAWQSGAFQWKSYECVLNPAENIPQLVEICPPLQY
jgi:hypothetical protein